MKQLTAQSNQIRKQLNRIAAEIIELDQEIVKIDPTKDREAAEELEKSLHLLRRQIEAMPTLSPFSAKAQDIHSHIGSLLEKADQAEGEELAALCRQLGIDEYSPEYLDYWQGLNEFVERQGFSSEKQEIYIGEAQLFLEPIFEHFALTPPFPQVSPPW